MEDIVRLEFLRLPVVGSRVLVIQRGIPLSFPYENRSKNTGLVSRLTMWRHELYDRW